MTSTSSSTRADGPGPDNRRHWRWSVFFGHNLGVPEKDEAPGFLSNLLVGAGAPEPTGSSTGLVSLSLVGFLAQVMLKVYSRAQIREILETTGGTQAGPDYKKASRDAFVP